MKRRVRWYLAAVVGAVNAYVFAALAFSGRLHLLELAAYLVVFVVVVVVFEYLLALAVADR